MPNGDVAPVGFSRGQRAIIEGAGLGTFMISACTFATLLWHPASPVRQLMDGVPRRAVMGIFMAATAISIAYSRWGRRAGAHLNPALTLTFLRLGKIAPRDAGAYIAAQFIGGATGVMIAHAALGNRLAHPAVNFVVTRPGPTGILVALGAELVISALLMATVLLLSAATRFRSYAAAAAASLVALFITFETPLSGMSMNPARTTASVIAAGGWQTTWIYFVAPLAGMLLSAELVTRSINAARQQGSTIALGCANLAHPRQGFCHFCEYERDRKQHPHTRVPLAKAVTTTAPHAEERSDEGPALSLITRSTTGTRATIGSL
jgi:aquaporin Z